jgi:prepilin-type N-terminal cleavage/methylation domain-containing protein
MFKTDSEGYSLMEVIVVLAIIGVLCSLAFASMHDYAGSIKLRAAIETIAVDIRLARVMAWSSRESCYLSFDPATNSYTMNGSRYVNIPEGIRFGTDPSVKGKPTDPGEMPPADGISFESEGMKNRAHFHPKGTVIPTGALYLTNGKETMAITVTLTGRTRLWRSCGGKKWTAIS